MSKQLPELSAFFDDELEDHAVEPLLKTAVRDSEMRAAWQAYALIGDHLREESSLSTDMTACVMARLKDEPVVLAPRNLPQTKRHHPLLALAAAVAGIAVVGWLALFAVPPAPTFIEARRAAPAPVVATAETSPMRNDMNEYLLAHQTQSSSFRLGESTEHVRTVAFTGRPVSP